MELKLQMLSEKIEKLRTYLHSLINSKQLTDKSVVSCSQQLDELLTEYEVCRKNISSRDVA